jgi:hypothetical protein
MPEISFELNDHQTRMLEIVRQQQGLETLDQAAEWLIKQRLRKASLKITGRNRALYPIRGTRRR